MFNSRWRPKLGLPSGPRYAAIDLGSNNCRLLIATPRWSGFRVVDSFSRIVRLGQGVASTGTLAESAITRTLEALSRCAERMDDYDVVASRCVATQACRAASNGHDFIARVKAETGISLEIIDPSEEARLSVRGCTDLVDPAAQAAIVFDIGGGSTELSWLTVEPDGSAEPKTTVQAWTSLPIGVVTLSERHGAPDMSLAQFSAMAADVAKTIRASVTLPSSFEQAFSAGRGHLIGTSGTVTSLAGVHLSLRRYQRRLVDGLWLSDHDVGAVTERLRAMSPLERSKTPCIGKDRADLVVPGAAILAGLLTAWPAQRIRVGDRGLREGILRELMETAFVS